ncbi:myosin-9 isoform X2 [Harmonia axyridis]|uniref:myosin-9 isoform X2 n=1 Tax=Harmonia axyridis TaxID=115357 RepID=UPI001E2799C8|nr:myosin-9 isoform X2 [Harmonia axyridis]
MSIFIRGTNKSSILSKKISDRDEQLLKELREQKDTRISDRIRKRSSQQLIQPDMCDTPINNRKNSENIKKGSCKNMVDNQSKPMFSSIQQNIYACSCSKQSTVVSSPASCTKNQIPSSRKPVISNINSLKCFDTTDEEESFKKRKDTSKVSLHENNSKTIITTAGPKKRVPVTEIPTKPKVTLKSVKSPIRPTGQTSQTQLQKKYGPSRFLATHVERINEDSLIISPEPHNNDEFLEKIRQRDRDAIIRGQKALEKEKLQREYNEMMKKLPALQKLERLYEMNQDKPEYHMTEERLREQEKKKQSILDDTYEKLFPDRHPPTITIPVKNASKASIGEKDNVNINENSPSLNLGNWEIKKKSKKLYTEEEVEALLREGKIPSESKFRTDQLKSVLEKLRKQKEEILKEIQTQNLSEALPLPTNSKVSSKENGNTSDSSTISSKSKKGKSEEKIGKKSVKVGTNSLESSVSCDTIEEPIKKQTKSVKQTTKLKSQAVQVTENLKKSKPSTDSKSTKESTKTVKEIKTKKQISREHSTSDLKKSTSKENIKTNSSSSDKNQKLAGKNKPDNSATLCVPTNSLVSVNEHPNQKAVKDQNKQIKSCDCENNISKKSTELCEIVIKIKDRKSSEVLIKKDNFKNGKDKKEYIAEKPLAVNKSEGLKENKINRQSENRITNRQSENKTTNRQSENKTKEKGNQRMDEIKKALNDDCCQSKHSSKPESWHEKFSKNNSQVSTSSTSYMSLPEPSNMPDNQSKVLPYFCNLIGKKPQQLNLNEIASSIKLPENQDLLGEVQKLLGMSRQSIDELGISSVSTVTTPSQSVIDLESNKLNTSTTYSTNTRIDLINEICQTQNQTTLPNFSFLTVSSENKTVVASEIDSNNEQYPDILAKYAKIADQCSQRISDLTSMIQKVREDKNRMLQTSSILPTNDSSTKYMDLPSPNKSNDTKDSTKEQRSISSSSSGDSKLLDINFSLAEKLKGLTPEELKNFSKQHNNVNNSIGEEDLAKRLKALKESPVLLNENNKAGSQLQNKKTENTANKKTSTQPNNSHVVPPVSGSKEGNSTDFIPFLLDIPKLPALAADSTNTKHKKPPPSKSFMVARKFTDFVAPHELSTIPEQDSQMKFESTIRDKSPKDENKFQAKETISISKKSPIENKGKPNSSPKGNNPIIYAVTTKSDNNIHLKVPDPKPTIIRTTSSPIIRTTSPINSHSKSSSKTKESSNYSDNSLGSLNTSGDEKVEMLRIEAMLRSIGMDWAIPTLRKTQEALALTSSSSSIDMKSPSLKQLNESDIKEYFSKQLFQKISSSTLRTDASPGSLNESRDLSDIQNSDFAYKQTSTPVNGRELYEAHDRSTDLPSAIESDKMTNDFFSLPEHSH